MKPHSLLAAAVLLAGCSSSDRMFTNLGHLRDTLAVLPSGDQITAEADIVERFGSPAQTTPPSVIWRRPATEQILIKVQGQGERSVALAGKILSINGEIKNCTSLRGTVPPTLHVAADGNRAWLSTPQGQVVASFDYDTAQAYFAPANQPAWAQ